MQSQLPSYWWLMLSLSLSLPEQGSVEVMTSALHQLVDNHERLFEQIQ